MAIQAHRPQARSVRRVSLRTTLFFEVLALLVLTVAFVSFASFFLSWNELSLRVSSQLLSIAQNKETLLEATIVRQREQLSTLGHDPALRALASLTELVGFKKLMRIDMAGRRTTIAGDAADELSAALVTELSAIQNTVFRPVVSKDGWKLYVIASPQTTDGARIGTLVATFDASALASRLLATEQAGRTAEVLLATRLNGENLILRLDETTGQAVPTWNTDSYFPLVDEALSGSEGVSHTEDYSGIPVIAAYRSIPSLGWAVIGKVDRFEATEPVLRLALNIAGAGLMIVIFLSLSMFFLSRRIVGPLEELVRKLDGLEARNWRFAKTISTGNELETVDAAADDLTHRLRDAHEHLEELVKVRTNALLKEHAEDAAILETMDDGLVVTDDKGIVTYMNRTGVLLTGISDAPGRKITDVLRIGNKDGQLINADMHPVLDVLRTHKRFSPKTDPEFLLLGTDGKTSALQLRATPMLRGKKCYGVVAIIRDTTEERRIDHMKSEFISLVSHQLRTPLSSMRWYLEMLIADDAGPLSQEQKDYVAQAAASNARMVHLVNALLNVSRIELGKFQLSPETIDLVQLCRAVAATFDLELKQKKVKVAFDVAKGPVGVRSDKGLLILILENLLSNAVKYSTAGASVTIGVSQDAKTGYATLLVADTGIGIPSTQQKDIGHKLFRATNAKATDTDGNGLGLYISHVAADSIGADLSFSSRENGGTKFSLRIPLDHKQESLQ